MNQKDYQKLISIPETRFKIAARVVLTLGVSKVTEMTAEEIIDGLSNLSGFMEGGEIKVIAGAAKCLAGIDSAELLGYIHFCDFEFRDPDPGALHDEDGICPVCGAEVKYDGNEEDDGNGGGTWGWDCPECGASGKAGFNKVFDRHYNVTDGDGESIPGRPD